MLEFVYESMYSHIYTIIGLTFVCLFVFNTIEQFLSDHHEIWYTGRWTQEDVNRKEMVLIRPLLCPPGGF